MLYKYKVIAESTVSKIEEEINKLAEEGYHLLLLTGKETDTVYAVMEKEVGLWGRK